MACKFGVLCVKRQTLKAEETGSDENFCYALLLSRQIMNLFLLIFYVHFYAEDEEHEVEKFFQ